MLFFLFFFGIGFILGFVGRFLGFLFGNSFAHLNEGEVGKTGHSRKAVKVGNYGVTDVELLKIFELFNAGKVGKTGVFERHLLELGERRKLIELLEVGKSGCLEHAVKGNCVAHAVHSVKLGVVASLLHLGNLCDVEGAENTKVLERDNIFNLCDRIVNEYVLTFLGLFITVSDDAVGSFLVAKHYNRCCISSVAVLGIVTDRPVVNKGFNLVDIFLSNVTHAFVTERGCISLCESFIFELPVRSIDIADILASSNNNCC